MAGRIKAFKEKRKKLLERMVDMANGKNVRKIAQIRNNDVSEFLARYREYSKGNKKKNWILR
jgi:hypothetical protein